MCEFIPFQPFTQYSSKEHWLSGFELGQHTNSDSDINTDESFNLNTSYENRGKKVIVKSTSEQHNMIKHFINLMKKMVGKSIEAIGNIYTKSIIQQIWKVFVMSKNPTRKILKAMFDRKPSKKLIEQMGFITVLNQYGLEEYLRAMEELREEVIFRMSGSNLVSHLMERQIQRKERLRAYSEYLVKYEIRKGEILNRTTELSKKIIYSILNTNKKDGDIDVYLN